MSDGSESVRQKRFGLYLLKTRTYSSVFLKMFKAAVVCSNIVRLKKCYDAPGISLRWYFFKLVLFDRTHPYALRVVCKNVV